MGMGGNRDYFSEINGNWTVVLRFPKAGNRNGNGVMGMGGNGYTKIIPADSHISTPGAHKPTARCRAKEYKGKGRGSGFIQRHFVSTSPSMRSGRPAPCKSHSFT